MRTQITREDSPAIELQKHTNKSSEKYHSIFDAIRSPPQMPRSPKKVFNTAEQHFNNLNYCTDVLSQNNSCRMVNDCSSGSNDVDKWR